MTRTPQTRRCFGRFHGPYIVLTAGAILFTATAAAAARYIELAQPTAETTTENCGAIARYNGAILAEIAREHSACISQPSTGTTAATGICASADCIDLHRLQDAIRSEIEMINRSCRQRISKQETARSRYRAPDLVEETMSLSNRLERPFDYDISDAGDSEGSYTQKRLRGARQKLAVMLRNEKGLTPEGEMMDFMFKRANNIPVAKSHAVRAISQGMRDRLFIEFSRIHGELNRSLSDLEAGKNAIRTLDQGQFRPMPFRINGPEINSGTTAKAKPVNTDCDILKNVITSSQLMDQDIDRWMMLTERCGQL